MQVLLFLSDMMIPLVIFYIVGFGLLMKRNIYEDLVPRNRHYMGQVLH